MCFHNEGFLVQKPVVIDRAAFNQGQNAAYEPHIEQTQTMDSLVARGPHAVGQPIPFRKSRRACSDKDYETWVNDDKANTLNLFDASNTRTTHAIAFQPGNLVRQAGASPSETTFPTLSIDSGDQNPHVATEMAVRRLTPVECERLQGFPDNWSRIPWKGKPEEECPDGLRYKVCGNSMAVPVMRWIGERIKQVESERIKK
jgi:site-specific DNA-cytosine methylase